MATATKDKPGTLVTLEQIRKEIPKDVTFETLVKALAPDTMESSELGDGFSVLPTSEKPKLVGVPFLILDWNINEGQNGEFASVRLITSNNQRLIINDGSTGICRQLQELASKGESRAILCRHGLRRSDYTTNVDGKEISATTFYLDTSGV